MQNLCESLRRCPRRCTIIYLNPVCHDDLVEKTPFRLVKIHRSWSTWFEYRIYQNVSEDDAAE